MSARGMDYPNIMFVLQVGWTASNLMPYLGGQRLDANGLNIDLLGQRRTRGGDQRPLQRLTYVVWVNLSTTMGDCHRCRTVAVDIGAATAVPYPEQLKLSTMLLSRFLVVRIGDQKFHQSPEVRGVNLAEHLNDCLKGQHVLKVRIRRRDLKVRVQTRDLMIHGQTRDLKLHGRTCDLKLHRQTRNLKLHGRTCNLKLHGRTRDLNVNARTRNLKKVHARTHDLRETCSTAWLSKSEDAKGHHNL